MQILPLYPKVMHRPSLRTLSSIQISRTQRSYRTHTVLVSILLHLMIVVTQGRKTLDNIGIGGRRVSYLISCLRARGNDARDIASAVLHPEELLIVSFYGCSVYSAASGF